MRAANPAIALWLQACPLAGRVAELESLRGGVAARSEMESFMKQKYEYKFVRLGEGWWGAKRAAGKDYQEQIHQHARDGWRLVQVFAPCIGAAGTAKYYELILEREVSN